MTDYNDSRLGWGWCGGENKQKSFGVVKKTKQTGEGNGKMKTENDWIWMDFVEQLIFL